MHRSSLMDKFRRSLPSLFFPSSSSHPPNSSPLAPSSPSPSASPSSRGTSPLSFTRERGGRRRQTKQEKGEENEGIKVSIPRVTIIPPSPSLHSVSSLAPNNSSWPSLPSLPSNSQLANSVSSSNKKLTNPVSKSQSVPPFSASHLPPSLSASPSPTASDEPPSPTASDEPPSPTASEERPMSNNESIECSSLLLEENGNCASLDTLTGSKPFTIRWTDVACHAAPCHKRPLWPLFQLHNGRQGHASLDGGHSHTSSASDVYREGEEEEEDADIILRSQSGHFKSGTMNAIIGGRSARSALIGALSGQRPPNRVIGGQISTGQVTLTSTESRDSLLKVSIVRASDLGGQRSHGQRQLSIKQILQDALMFEDANESKFGNFGHFERTIEKVTETFKLSHFLNRKIEELPPSVTKLLTIAIELVTCPDVLVIETDVYEPEVARMMSKYLRSGDNRNLLVIWSLKTLSYKSASEHFDTVYVINESGTMVIQEETLKLPLAVKSQITGTNDFGLQEEDPNQNGRVGVTPDANRSSLQLAPFSDLLEAITNHSRSLPSTYQPDSDFNQVVAPIGAAIRADPSREMTLNVVNLLKRQFIQFKSDPVASLAPLLLSLAFVLFLGTLFSHGSIDTSDGCLNSIINVDKYLGNQSMVHFLSHSSLASVFTNSVSEVSIIVDSVKFILLLTNFLLIIHSVSSCLDVHNQVNAIRREIGNKWYSISSLVASSSIVSGTIIAIQVTLLTGMVTVLTGHFSLTGSADGLSVQQLATFAIGLFFLILISELVGSIIGALIADKVTAILSTLVLCGYFVLFGGYFMADQTLPAIFRVLPMTSHVRQSFELLILSLYGLGRCTSKSQVHLHHDIDLDDIMTSRPLDLIGRAFKGMRITPKVSKVVSPMIGLKDDVCLGQVINATRNYLGIGNDADDDHDGDSDYNSVKDALDTGASVFDEDDDFDGPIDAYEKLVDTSSDSLPLLLFGFKNSDVHSCLLLLLLIAIGLKVAQVVALRRSLINRT